MPLNWATPASVMPHAMSDSLNPEWPNFEDQLAEYLAGPVDSDSISNYDNKSAVTLPAAIRSKIPQEKVNFEELESYLETCAATLTVEEKLLVVQHLYAFEYILNEQEIKSVQALLRKWFKSNTTPAMKIAFFKKMQAESGCVINLRPFPSFSSKHI